MFSHRFQNNLICFQNCVFRRTPEKLKRVGGTFTRDYITGKLHTGRPYLKFNSMTERFDFLYLESGFESSFTRETSTEKRADKVASSLGGASAGGEGAPASFSSGGATGATGGGGGGVAPSPASGAAPGGKYKPAKAGAAAAKKRAGAALAPGGGKAAKVGANGDATPDGKKQLYNLATAVKLKARFLTETAEATTLIGMIEAEESWAWARGNENLGQLVTAKSSVDAYKQNAFFKLLAFDPNFKKSAQDQFTPDQLIRELTELEPFERKLDLLRNTRNMILETANLRQNLLA